MDLCAASSGSSLALPVTDLLFCESLLTFAKCIAKHTFISFVDKSKTIDYVLNFLVIDKMRSVLKLANAGSSTRNLETMLYIINPFLMSRESLFMASLKSYT